MWERAGSWLWAGKRGLLALQIALLRRPLTCRPWRSLPLAPRATHPCAEKLRVLFDSPPTSSQTLSGVDPSADELLVSGAAPAVPSPPAVLPLAAHRQKGLAAAVSRKLEGLADSPAAPLLRRYSRLLVLEEATMEQVGGWAALVAATPMRQRSCCARCMRPREPHSRLGPLPGLKREARTRA